MEGIQEQILPIETIEGFHKFQDRWEDASEMADEIFSGVQKTANDIISHHTRVMRAALRKTKAQEAFEQKDEIKKIRQQASEAAQLIKKRMEPASVVTHEIYKVNFAGIPAITPLPCLTNPPELESESAWARPFLLSNDDIKLWLGDDKVQEVLTRYGCGYQKEIPKAKLAESCGRTQQRIDNENVIASAKELMDKMICKQVDISSVDGGEQFMKGQWLYGFLPHPDMAFCGLAPKQCRCCENHGCWSGQGFARPAFIARRDFKDQGRPTDRELVQHRFDSRLGQQQNQGHVRGWSDDVPRRPRTRTITFRSSRLDHCRSVNGWIEIDLWLQKGVHAIQSRSHSRVQVWTRNVQEHRAHCRSHAEYLKVHGSLSAFLLLSERNISGRNVQVLGRLSAWTLERLDA